MKNLLTNRVFLGIIIGILVFLNIFCFAYTRLNDKVECPIYIVYTDGTNKDKTTLAEETFDEIQDFIDIKGERSFLLLTPESPKYNDLTSAYSLSNKTNAFLAVSETGKVLAYKYPIPSLEEIRKIMTALAY